MAHFPQILASGDDGVVKLIFVVIALAIGGISTLAKSLKQKQEMARRREAAWQQALEKLPNQQPGQPPGPPPMPPRPIANSTRTAPKPFAGIVRPGQTGKKRPPQQRQRPAPRPTQFASRPITAPPPVSPVTAETPSLSTSLSTQTASVISSSEIGSAGGQARKRSPSANANSLRAWMKPSTLRTQFIVTEIFQPPAALRGNEKSEW